MHEQLLTTKTGFLSHNNPKWASMGQISASKSSLTHKAINLGTKTLKLLLQGMNRKDVKLEAFYLKMKLLSLLISDPQA